MMLTECTPYADGFSMPGEFAPHHGCILIWPERPGSWPHGARAAQAAFAEIACAIAQSETVYMLVSRDNLPGARAVLPDHILLVEMQSNDAWARDVGPTFVKHPSGAVRGINWQFNAWGGEYDGLYADWDKDNLVASRFCSFLGAKCYDATPFVLEGGSIHSDGEGTVLTTEACLLSPGRNPELTRQDIEAKLHDMLGAEKVIWLPHGILGDETNEHVDNICAFTAPGHVVLAMPDEEDDPQYLYSRQCLDALSAATDAKGRSIQVHLLPMPQKPVCIEQQDLDGFVFAPGEAQRELGEQLSASYVNFYISNGGVIVPQFGDEKDGEAVAILQQLFPERTVYPIYARDIIVGGGNIHCITQQIPEGVFGL